MKKSLYTTLLLCVLLLTFSGCNDDTNSKYPKLIDVEFMVTATKQKVTSRIETSITTPTSAYGATNLDKKSSSYSNNHIPFNKKIIQQSIPSFAILGLRYQDDSVLNVGAVFEPYSVNLEIKIDRKIVADTTFSIDTEGKTIHLEYDFE
ncbi:MULTISPECIES: hypothetical protein [unclassified Polaribacter]|uniref:hypothetical protein n=1 Tax=unclassified Polaribacter TaxID=196858 RepID=UPI0011BF5B93|nr:MULTISPECIES: hypothetical protein [unclassified Polaribacter]TXD54388.1 hypothetical protein ES043_00630 [Polaribacter sp. IC063]TXD62781.1 hypothetical protein ES044_00130 [Polaribacter sp. IC066]